MDKYESLIRVPFKLKIIKKERYIFLLLILPNGNAEDISFYRKTFSQKYFMDINIQMEIKE